MNSYSCIFLGHRDCCYDPLREKIKAAIEDLICLHNTAQFYCGYRGNFDRLCACLVCELKIKYPHIINTMLLSYHPKPDFILPDCFDDSVYLLDKPVPQRFAIIYTNRKAVEISDYILSGVIRDYGGAFTACKYARKLGKTIININE